MDIEFVKSNVRKSNFTNEAQRLQGVQIPVALNMELVYPNVVQEGSIFLLVNRCAIGNPIQKISMFIEQVNSFKIVNLEEGFDTSRENMQKFISVICHPIALREMQKTVDTLTGLYSLSPIKIPSATDKGNRPGNVVDLAGKGMPQ